MIKWGREQERSRQPGHQPVSRKFWPETVPWRGPNFPVGTVLFLAGSWFYVWLRVEPLLEYHRSGPFFFRQYAFLQPFLACPGGLANYAGVFTAQLNGVNWLGALVFVLSEWLVFLAARACLARLSGRPPGGLAWLAPFCLLLLRNQYDRSVSAVSLGFLLALAAGATCSRLPWRRPWLAVAVSGVVSHLVFYLAGLWSALLVGLLCGLFLALRGGAWLPGASCVILAAVGPVLAIFAGRVEVWRLWNPWPGRLEVALTSALYASVPLTATGLALWPRAPADPAPPGSAQARAVRAQVVVGLLAFLLGAAALWLTFDQRQKLLAQIDYCASRGEDDAVLAAARQAGTLNEAARARVQLALYHTGRLAEELFSFHSQVEDPAPGGTGDGCRAQSQTLLELGLINNAQHMACEALVMDGDRPDLLRQLALIHRLKQQPQAAQVFLNVLSLIPFQGECADESWPQAAAPTGQGVSVSVPTPALTNDIIHEGIQARRLLEVLLAANPSNRMAFEYAMAASLLDLDLKKAVAHLQLLDNFHYPRVPQAYEEAVLLFQQLARAPVNLKGRTIRPATVERFQRFQAAARQYQPRPEDLAAMAASFGDTYWYYYYTMLGRKRTAEVQTAAP